MRWWVSNDSTQQAIRCTELPAELRGLFHPATLEEYSLLGLYSVKV